MPLRDSDELHRWIERESPSAVAQRVERYFLAEIGDEAWRSPSVPVEILSNQPQYEVRQVALQVWGEERPVQVRYRHSYTTDAVDVIAVTNR